MEKVVKKIFTILGGRERNIPIEVGVEEWEEIGFGGRKYQVKRVFLKVMGKVPVADVFYSSRFNTPVAEVSSVWHKQLGELFHRNVPRKDVYFAISEDDFKRIQNLQKKIEEENEKARQEMKESTSLAFRVGKKMIAIADMKYEAVVFIPTKDVEEMTETEKQRYKKLCDAITQFGDKNKYEITHGIWPDKVIDARRYEKGKKYTLDDLEKTFAYCLSEYDKHVRVQEEEKKRKQAEYERKKEEALKKAKETGTEVPIAIVGYLDGDELYPGKEMGLIVVWEYATPDGKIIKKYVPTY